MSGEQVTVRLDAKTAVELHGLLTIMRAEPTGTETIDTAFRDAHLAVEGALRAIGFRPTGDGEWERRPTRRR